MGNISDRDKTIMVVLAIAMIVLLPYFFYIKDTKVETETIWTNVDLLQARYDELNAMNQNREFYEQEIVRLHEERDAIIAEFPAGIDNANYTMFLLQTEYSSDYVLNETTGEYALEYPIIFDSVSYGQNIQTPISTLETDTGYVGLTNTSVVTYSCYYGGMKYLLEYLMDYKDPMIYRAIDMVFDSETGVITGAITLAQYAVEGEGRELPPTSFDIEVGGETIDLDLDNNDMRGNEEEENGIFGPRVRDELEVEEEVVVPEEGEVVEE